VSPAQKPVRKPLGLFWRSVVGLGRLMTGIACCGLAVMIALVCVDVLLRIAGHPVKGAYDLVRIAAAVTIACSLPITTAMKGHVAIEYFFRKLNRPGRIAVDSVMRLLMIAAFLFAAAECVGYGLRFLRNRQVSDTIEVPIFWVPWVMAAAFAVTALVVMFHLVYPGREMVKS
jgi:TRAP-type C4-dicarboxylate transport system permease small subunit